MPPLFSNTLIFIERHESDIPWLKVFTQRPVKEFSEATLAEKEEIWRVLDIIEREMLAYYHPTKINLASFGNMLPHLHWHIMARFEADSHFPEPMWGEKKRESTLGLPEWEPFLKRVVSQL